MSSDVREILRDVLGMESDVKHFLEGSGFHLTSEDSEYEGTLKYAVLR